MTTREIVQKLWNLCNVLRHGGITYYQYVTELTYLLFLKMAKETGEEDAIPAAFRWDALRNDEDGNPRSGLELKKYYARLLGEMGESATGLVREIYEGAASNVDEPKNLKKLVDSIDELDWYSAREEGLGNLYEGLLEKNMAEMKSGAGQYFTPRPLVDVMTRLTAPQVGERCNDPACGTFGFMIAADRFVREATNDYCRLMPEEAEFQLRRAFSGVELVRETYRLALMNAALHGVEGEIARGDTLSSDGKRWNDFDVVLANPPFGTKNGGERASRDDFLFPTSNKQLNFLQHIYRSLKPNGKARAAVVLPDNVLFADKEGEKIRVDLMEKCDLHTILRLPTRIFYAKEVKANVLFFRRGVSDSGNTKRVRFYDLRTNMPSFGKTRPLTVEDFAAFESGFNASDVLSLGDERWSVFTREEIAARGNTLNLGLIRDDSVLDYDELPDPLDCGEECVAQLEEALDLMKEALSELRRAVGERL